MPVLYQLPCVFKKGGDRKELPCSDGGSGFKAREDISLIAAGRFIVLKDNAADREYRRIAIFLKSHSGLIGFPEEFFDIIASRERGK